MAAQNFDEETGDDNPELSLDERLAIDLAAAFAVYSDRQREIRRLAKYMQERVDDIDDARARAQELIGEKLNSVDAVALEGLMEIFSTAFDEAMEDDEMPEEERAEVFYTTVQAVSASLPSGALSSYLNSIARVTFTPSATPMLFGSLLITLVGELETLVGHVARALYAHDDSSLGESGRTYTWAQVLEYGGIAELREDAIEQAVEALLRESFTSWVQTLNKRFHVPLPALSGDFDTLEVIQRRHVLVHNAGRASRQYMKSLDSFPLDVEQDDHLTVDYDYLLRASDILFVVALSLVHGATVKNCSEQDVKRQTESRLVNTCFHLLQEKRYEVVVSIVKAVDLKKMVDESSRHILQVNGWLALKHLGRFGQCRAEVRNFDTRSKSNDLRLAKLALLDEVADADALAQEMLASGELAPEHWLTWPLLAGVRTYHEAQSKAEGASASSQD